MKKIAVAAVTAWLMMAFPAEAQQAARAGGLQWEETVWELSVKANAGKMEHLFRFKNPGPRPVVIKDVKTSCGCTAAVVTGRMLYRPGESGAIKAVFNPSGHEGSVSTAVKVFTNLAEGPVDLFIKAQVTAPAKTRLRVDIPAARIKVTPGTVDLGTMELGQHKTYRLIIENVGREPLRISNINAPNSDTDQPLSAKRIMPGKKVELTGVFQAVKKGKVDDFLLLRTNDPQFPAYRVKLTGRVR